MAVLLLMHREERVRQRVRDAVKREAAAGVKHRLVILESWRGLAGEVEAHPGLCVAIVELHRRAIMCRIFRVCSSATRDFRSSYTPAHRFRGMFCCEASQWDCAISWCSTWTIRRITSRNASRVQRSSSHRFA